MIGRNAVELDERIMLLCIEFLDAALDGEAAAEVARAGALSIRVPSRCSCLERIDDSRSGETVARRGRHWRGEAAVVVVLHAEEVAGDRGEIVRQAGMVTPK